MGDVFSREEIVAYGGISEAQAVEVRSSSRIRAQADADDSQLDRAQRRAQERDHLGTPGTSSVSKFTIASFSDEVVVDRATKLGVSLGVSPSRIRSSVANIKEIYLNRTLVMLKKNEDELKQSESSLGKKVMDEALELSTDLQEREQSGSEGHKDLEVSELRKKRVYTRRKYD